MTQGYRDQGTKHFFAATNERVMRIDSRTGKVVWDTRIPEASGYLVTLLLDLDRLYAGTARRVACLDAGSGEVLWATTVAKLGEPVSLALDPRPPGMHLIASSAGLLFGLDADSGALLWDEGLSGMGYHPVCLRVQGGIVAQPKTRLVSSGKSTRTEVLESDQEND